MWDAVPLTTSSILLMHAIFGPLNDLVNSDGLKLLSCKVTWVRIFPSITPTHDVMERREISLGLHECMAILLVVYIWRMKNGDLMSRTWKVMQSTHTFLSSTWNIKLVMDWSNVWWIASSNPRFIMKFCIQQIHIVSWNFMTWHGTQ